MQCRKLLLEMRKKRGEELEEYAKELAPYYKHSETLHDIGVAHANMKLRKITNKADASISPSPITNIDSMLAKRRLLLTLELPFVIDTLSVNKAMIESSASFSPVENKNVENWSHHYTHSQDCLNAKYITPSLTNFFKNGEIIPKIHTTQFDSNGKMQIKENLIKPEDFIWNSKRDELIDNIKKLPISASSKKTRCSQAQNMMRYFRNEMPAEKIPHPRVTLDALACYFEYLENRCLTASSDIPYRDLLAIRLLFYVPLQIETLQSISLQCLDAKAQEITCSEGMFHVPKTFIELACALYKKGEALLQRNTKQLNKFVCQTATVAKQKNITPTALRRGLEYLCYKESFFRDKLPLR